MTPDTPAPSFGTHRKDRRTRPPNPPAGTSYHRLARTEPRRWWRPIAATLTAVVCWLVLAFPVVLGLFAVAHAAGLEGAWYEAPPADSFWTTALAALVTAAALPAFLLAARVVQHRGPGTLASVTGRLRGRWLLACAATALPCVFVMYFVKAFLFDVSTRHVAPHYVGTVDWVGWPAFSTAAVVILALIPLLALAEEYVLRGWVLQFLGSYLGTPWVAVVVAAALYALLAGLGAPWILAWLAVVGLFLGTLVLRTGGLEAAIGFTVVNYLYLGLFAAASKGRLEELFGTGVTDTWTLAAAGTVALSMYAWMVLRMARKRGIARTVPGPGPARGAAGPLPAPA